MIVAYVNRPQRKRLSVLSTTRSREDAIRAAHFIQPGTPETLCAKVFTESIEVDESQLENMRLCKICQMRAAKLIQLPRGRLLLGVLGD